MPAALVAAGLALVVVYTLRELLAPGFDRLPGTDAGNLYSWELFTRSVLATGRLPHWNPYQFGGTPHLADTQTTVLYPPALLLRWLPAASFLPWMAALHIWLGGIGTLFLGRVVGLGWLSAAAAALAVTLGGSIAPWLSNGHLLLIYCAAWLPWALGLAILSVRRATVWPHPLLAVVLVLQFLAGYLQGSVYITAAVGLYFLGSVAWPDPEARGAGRWRPFGQLVTLGTLALGLSAFQLLPTARLASEAARTSGLSFDVAAAGGWTAADLATFFFPFRGIESETPHRWMSDRAAYVGWLLVCLVPLALFDRDRRRIIVFFGILAAGAVALGFGSNLPFYQAHYALFPGFRIPGRLLFIATVGIALLGAIGLERLMRLASRRTTRIPAMVGATALIVVAVDLTGFWAGAVQAVPVPPADAVRRWLGPPEVGRALSLCENTIGPYALLLNRQPTFDGVGGVHLRDYADWAALEAIDGPIPVRRDLLDASNVTSIVACGELEEASFTLRSHVDPVYVYRNDRAWPRVVWTCAAVELSRPDVIDGLRVGRYEDRRLVKGYLVNVRWTAGVSEAQRRGLEARYRLHEPEHREGDTWRYRVHDLTREDIAALLADPAVDDTHGLDRQTGELIERTVEIEEDAWTEMLIGAGSCDERHDVEIEAADQPDGRVAVNVAASVPGVLFFSEPYYPERRAFVDGVEVTAIKANVAFTAVPVDAGPHRVELRYVPASFHAGAAISAATLCLWIGAATFGRIRRRRPDAAGQDAAELPMRP